MDIERFPKLVASVYALVDELEKMFPGRHFTPDGHMVGSLGEALAAHYYGVELHSASTRCHDGICGALNVQVKATQGDRISISGNPDHLLVLLLHRDGAFDEIYNGPGALVWNLVAGKKRPRNGQFQVPLTKLRSLMHQVSSKARLQRVRA